MELGARTRPYRQVARAEAQELTRDALIAAAQREFFAGRWEESSLEAIASSAGVTKQTLLRHFGSKDGLLERALSGVTTRSATSGSARRVLTSPGRSTTCSSTTKGGASELSDSVPPMWLAAISELGRRARRLHYDWIEHAFGSALARLGVKDRRRRRAALVALCDVHAWWLLSHDLELSRGEVRATLIDAIQSLIPEETPQ